MRISLENLLDDLEKEVKPFEHYPLVTVPKRETMEEIIQEYAEFNAINWDTVTTLKIAQSSDAEMYMSPKIRYFLLPKYLRAIIREYDDDGMAMTVFETLLRRLISEVAEPETVEILHPELIGKVYYLLQTLEYNFSGEISYSLVDEYLKNALTIAR